MTKPIVWQPLTGDDHTRIWEHINNAVAAIRQANEFTGTEAAIIGTNPPPGTQIRRDEYKIIGTVESPGGGCPLPFQTPFPNGLISCQAEVISGAQQLYTYAPGISTAQWYVTAHYSDGSPMPQGTQVTVSVSATGW